MSNLSTARRLTADLGGDWHGSYGTVPAPGHSARDRSVSVRQHSTDLDDVIVHSFAGDDPVEIKREWRARGLLPSRGQAPRPAPRLQPAPRPDTGTSDADRIEAAWAIWRRAQPAAGTVAERYVATRCARGGAFACPNLARFLPASPKWPEPALILPFGIATEPEPGLLDMPRAAFRGIHLTRLLPDGSARVPGPDARRMVGPVRGSPICLRAITDGLALVIGEGIENTLIVADHLGMGAWAAGSASLMPALADAVPGYVEAVTIAADDDGPGQSAAHELARRLDHRGIEVHLPAGGSSE
jgi:hypothetical protein